MKTEHIIEEQIDPRILETLFANFPNAETAMLELTDNAIGDRIPDEKMVLTIRITPSLIKVLNKGGWGMGLDHLRNFLTWGRSEATGIFRFFGQGGKAAIGYLGKRFLITSFPKDGDRSYIIEEAEDWTKRLNGQLKTYPVGEDKKLVFDSGRVEINIHSLSRKPSLKKMRHLLQATYSKLLESGELQILFNDKWLLPEILSYDKQFDFEESTNYGVIKGRLGICLEGVGGIRCYSQKRLITPKEFFGLNPTEYDLSKLIGEIELDFVPVMPNKISYDTSSKEWKEVEASIKRIVAPLLEEIKGLGEIPPNLRRINEDLNKFVNDILHDLEFESQGRNSQSDITQITLKYDEGKKEIKHRPPEAKTWPEIDAVGITQRLGQINARLVPMTTESIRCSIIGKLAEVNSTFPAAAAYLKPYRQKTLYSYVVESVILELYKDKVATASELVENVRKALFLSAKKLQAS